MIFLLGHSQSQCRTHSQLGWGQEATPDVCDGCGDPLSAIDSLVQNGIARRAFPGAVVVVGVGDEIAKMTGYGSFTYGSEKPVTPQSSFDMASLTKVIATTTAVMQLHEAGRLDLDARVVDYLPDFGQNGKENTTVRHLLTHTSGLIPFIRFYEEVGFLTSRAVLDSIFATAPVTPPGVTYRYSDFGMIVMALLIEVITGQDFDAYTREHIFEPLGMDATGFRLTGIPDTSIVPTEDDNYFRFRLMQGEVHDETAWILGGTAGHAGLFSTAADVTRFVSMIAQGGVVKGVPFLKEETIRLFTTAVDTVRHTRALGWDTRSNREEVSAAGKFFGPTSFGHTGFTGTSIWIDPDSGLYVIILSNRVYPSRQGPYEMFADVRKSVADVAYKTMIGVPKEMAE